MRRSLCCFSLARPLPLWGPGLSEPGGWGVEGNPIRRDTLPNSLPFYDAVPAYSANARARASETLICLAVAVAVAAAAAAAVVGVACARGPRRRRGLAPPARC